MKVTNVDVTTLVSMLNVIFSLDKADRRVVMAYAEGMAAKAAQLSPLSTDKQEKKEN